MTSPTRAEFNALDTKVNDQKAQIDDPSTGLPGLAKKLGDAQAAEKALADRLTKIENPSWFKEQWAKGDIQLAATHAQLFKLDYSAIKFDEKGLTIFGRPVFGTDFLTSNRPVKEKVDLLNKRIEELSKRIRSTPAATPPQGTKSLPGSPGGGGAAKGDQSKQLSDVAKLARNADRAATEANKQAGSFKSQLSKVQKTATTAGERAKDAAGLARAVRTIANGAKRRADDAFTRGSSANTTAKSALTRADAAKEGANEARGSARSAVRTAEKAMSIADKAKGNADKAMRDVKALQGAAGSASREVDGLRRSIAQLGTTLQ